jgi:hypothetical protein
LEIVVVGGRVGVDIEKEEEGNKEEDETECNET